jgi:hypothetical protein
VRVQQLESQVRQLTDEVVQLRSALRAQQKLTEQLSQAQSPRQDKLYDESIASFREEQNENSLYRFYRQLIHSHLWLGGYLAFQAEARESTAEQSILALSRLGFTWRATLNEHLSCHGEIYLHDDDKLQLAHSYLLLSLSKSCSVKAGVVRIPFGRYNALYSPPATELGSLPRVDEWLIPTVWAEPGVSLFGQYELLPMLQMSYETVVSTGLGEGGFNPETGNRKARQGRFSDNNSDLEWSARLELIPKLGLDVFSLYAGFSGIIGRYDEAKNNSYGGWAFDWFLRIGSFSLLGEEDRLVFSGEWARMEAERDAQIVQKYPDTARHTYGYYLELQYHFFPEAWRDTFFLFGDESRFVLALRYDQLDLDTEKRGASRLDDATVYTVGCNFHPLAQTVLRVEYNWIREWVAQQWAWNNRVLVSVATHF